eukprot:272390_1
MKVLNKKTVQGVDKMTQAESTVKAQTWLSNLSIGDHIDAFDALKGNWEEATVTNIEKDKDNLINRVEVKYHKSHYGFSQRWIEINANNVLKKINQLHSFTIIHENKNCYENRYWNVGGECPICSKKCCKCARICIDNEYQCKKCSILQEHNKLLDILYHAAGNIITLDISILHNIASYSTGQITECFECKTEISFDNIFDIKKSITHDKKHVYSYKKIDTDKCKVKTFCHLCGKGKFKQCSHFDCINSIPVSSKFCNFHETIWTTCNNCRIGGTLYRCSNCKCAYVCSSCDIISEDKMCTECQKFQMSKYIRESLNTINDNKIINIISAFAIGIVVQCSNFVNCNNTICIFPLMVSGLYFYEVSCAFDPTQHTFIKLKIGYMHIKKSVILFCEDCTNDKQILNKCEICENKDVGKFCFNHLQKQCKICSQYTTNPSKCPQCNLLVCIKCLNGSSCNNCMLDKELSQMSKLIKQCTNFQDNEIINTLAQFSIGCIVECCLHSCNREICLNKKTELTNYQDSDGDRIYHYTNKKILNKKHSCYVYGKQRIIYCYYCTAFKLKFCRHPLCYGDHSGVIDVDTVYNFCSNHTKFTPDTEIQNMIGIIKNSLQNPFKNETIIKCIALFA